MIIIVAILYAYATKPYPLRVGHNDFNLSPLTFNLLNENLHHLLLYVNLFGVG